MSFKVGVKKSDAYQYGVNVDKTGKWRGTKTSEMCVQCNVALYVETGCFDYYHRSRGLC